MHGEAVILLLQACENGFKLMPTMTDLPLPPPKCVGISPSERCRRACGQSCGTGQSHKVPVALEPLERAKGLVRYHAS